MRPSSLRYCRMNMIFLYLLWLFILSITSFAEATDSGQKDRDVQRALFKASYTEDLPTISQALKDGADIDFRDPDSGQTVLMRSVLTGKIESVRFLLQAGADPTIPEKDGYLPPHGAGFQGRPEIMKILHESGINVHMYHEDGYLPFHRACWGNREGHTETIRYLLEIGTDVNVKSTKDQKTCMEITKNAATQAVLQEYGARGTVNKASDEL